jgi:cytohesin
MGSIDRVGAFLESDPGLIDATSQRGSTPLHMAASEGHALLVGFLIKHGADVDAANAFGRTPLNYAAQGNYLGIAQILIDNGASVDGAGVGGPSPLFSATDVGQVTMARFLIEAGADVNLESPGGNPLSRAAFRGATDIMRMLLDEGANLEATDARGWTPLHSAALEGRLEATRLLLERGCCPDPVDRGGRSPLVLAVYGANNQAEQVTLLLLEHGASVTTEPLPGTTPLLLAVLRGMTDAVESMLAKGADISVVEPFGGKSLLHIAAAAGYGDVVERLLEAGIDVNASDRHGRTPLFYAARHGNRRAAEMLHAAGGVGVEEENIGPSAYLEAPMAPGDVHVWKLRDRGWVVKTATRLFVFDNEEHNRMPDEPLLANGSISAAEISHLNVLALYTTYHADPYGKEFIHAIEDELDSVIYIHDKSVSRQGNRNALFIGGRGNFTMMDVDLTYSEEEDEGGMGWLDYAVQADGVSFYYGGYTGASHEDEAATLSHIASFAPGIQLAFIRLAGTGGGNGPEYAASIIEALEPEVVFLQGTLPDMPVEQGTIVTLRELHPGVQILTAPDPGERFSFSFSPPDGQ